MQTQMGIELCTAGSAEVLTAQGQYAITAGTLILHSPVFPMLELSRSADYASVGVAGTPGKYVFAHCSEHLLSATDICYDAVSASDR